MAVLFSSSITESSSVNLLILQWRRIFILALISCEVFRWPLCVLAVYNSSRLLWWTETQLRYFTILNCSGESIIDGAWLLIVWSTEASCYVFFIPPLVNCICIVTTNRQTVVLENIDIDVNVFMIVSVVEGIGFYQ